MSESWLKRAALAAMFVGAITTGAAYAQTAPAAPDAGQTSGGEATKPKPKPKPKAAKPKETKLPSVAVEVTNSRKVGLTELDAALSGHGDSVKILRGARRGKEGRHSCRARQAMPVRSSWGLR